MPEEIFGPDYSFLSNDKILSFDEIERITRIFVSLGVKITDYRRRTVTEEVFHSLSNALIK